MVIRKVLFRILMKLSRLPRRAVWCWREKGPKMQAVDDNASDVYLHGGEEAKQAMREDKTKET